MMTTFVKPALIFLLTVSVASLCLAEEKSFRINCKYLEEYKSVVEGQTFDLKVPNGITYKFDFVPNEGTFGSLDKEVSILEDDLTVLTDDGVGIKANSSGDTTLPATMIGKSNNAGITNLIDIQTNTRYQALLPGFHNLDDSANQTASADLVIKPILNKDGSHASLAASDKLGYIALAYSTRSDANENINYFSAALFYANDASGAPLISTGSSPYEYKLIALCNNRYQYQQED